MTFPRFLFPALLCALLAVTTASAGVGKLEALPSYQPEQKVSGVIRQFGSKMRGMVKIWEEGFRQYHPEVRFEDVFHEAAGIAGLYTNVADVGTSGREPVLTEYFSFYETFRYLPVEITVATGAFDVQGASYGLVVFVNKDNPLTQVTLKQMDGIFGAERTGGYKNFRWVPEAARGPEGNIRTWGQLGLTGEWANQPIHTYGYALTGMRVTFQQKVFQGGEKWNPGYREYVETNTKQVADESLTIRQMLTELSADKYGIAWTGLGQAKKFPRLKPVALAANEGGPYLMPSAENFRDRTYPLIRSLYFFINRKPGEPVDPKIKEYVRYVLSREGQEAVSRNGTYFALPAATARDEQKKIE
ncbi:MAG: hypothetical protein PHQ04_01260 [Opitutaceae bacterium]|nr:hypothetical protein [Opitutaceae bacterium]